MFIVNPVAVAALLLTSILRRC